MPAIYEIFPHFFFNFDVIQRAQMYKQRGFYGVKKVDGAYNLVIPANYSSYDVYSYEDQKLSYFTEDIGLNAYYYYFNLDYPFWMNGEEYGLNKDRRGEYFFFFHQQLMARYYLERLSNEMRPVKDFTWWTPIQSYYPNIRTYNGYPFMSRDPGHVVYQEFNHFDVDFIYSYENRLLEAIDSGLFLLQNGTYYNFSYPGGLEYLGNMVQGNPDSLNAKYYNYMTQVFKTFGRYFGKYQPYQSTVYPSVLSQPETTLRDPAYWSFMKRFLMFYYKFMHNMRPYTRNEINFDGVDIESVEMDKLITYFDYFDADITNAVDVEYQGSEPNSEFRNFGRMSSYRGEDFVIKARQLRLNHLPFRVNMKVHSKSAAPAVVRIFLGAKFNEAGHVLGIHENRYTFYLLDMFKYDLKTGINEITRESREFFFQAKDRTTYYDLYKYVMMATAGQKQYPMDNTEFHSGFPQRLLLPKGKKGGQVFKLFVHVSPYFAPKVQQFTTFDPIVSAGIGSGSRYIDSLPLGYPFDRHIDEFAWYTPNMHYQDVTIFHKTESEINSPAYQ